MYTSVSTFSKNLVSFSNYGSIAHRVIKCKNVVECRIVYWSRDRFGVLATLKINNNLTNMVSLFARHIVSFRLSATCYIL